MEYIVFCLASLFSMMTWRCNMFHVSELCAFLSLSSISVYGYTTFVYPFTVYFIFMH